MNRVRSPAASVLACCIALALVFATRHSVAADAKNLETLTAAEAEKLEAVKKVVQKEPVVKAATDKWKLARKAYQLDRAKYPADRVRQVSIDYRAAEKEMEAVTRTAMIDSDSAVEALLKKRPRARNAGENSTDSDDARNLAVKPIIDEPGLPRVLLIGDSISIGYTLQVRALLKGKANVHRIPVNGGATEVGIANMKAWLGDGRWDVIHFNFGLHDAKYHSATEFRASREVYAANLKSIGEQLQATGAKVIFATTTPTPKVLSTPTRRFDSIPERNKVAVGVMQDLGIAIDDLYSAVIPVQDKILRPKDVHFAPKGYTLLAERVAASIEAQLPKK